MAITDIAQAPPEVPSKYDIVPIHASDISAFNRCRRYWDWSSPTRTNLRRKVQIFGINTDLFFGTGIHYALEQYYDPVIQRDPVEAFSTWFHIQWKGGDVTKEWLDRSYDLNPKKSSDDTWYVKGLWELLPDPIEEEFEELRELGLNMMGFYREYAQKNDDFQVIAAESQFSIPLGFSVIDQRLESPNYGKELEVHARGKRDAIIQSLKTGQYGLNEYKTKGRIDDEYFESLNKDQQVTNYMAFSQEEAKLYDLPYRTISFCLHTALRKVYPKPPTETTKGLPSLDRQNESTTAEMFAEFVDSHGLRPWYDNDLKAQGYYNWLLETGDENFIIRTPVYRNKQELANQLEYVRMIAREMLSDPAIYPNPTGSWLCTHCQFRGPCIAADDGSDYNDMLKNGYERNLDR